MSPNRFMVEGCRNLESILAGTAGEKCGLVIMNAKRCTTENTRICDIQVRNLE